MYCEHLPGGGWRVRPAGRGERLRVAVLCSDDPHHAYLVSRVAEDLDLVGVIVEPGAAQQHRLWTRHAWVDSTARLYQVWRQRLTGRARYRSRYFAPITSRPGFGANRVLRVDWINSPAARDHLAMLRPDVTIVCGTTYLRSSILANAGLAINIHGGYLPQYKGNHCIFFALLRKDYQRIGATLHVVSAKLDGGAIIEVVRPEIYPHDNDEHLYSRSVHLGIDRLIEILTDFQSGPGELRGWPQPETGETFRHRNRTPWLDLWVWARRRLGLERITYAKGGTGPVFVSSADDSCPTEMARWSEG